MGYNMKRGNSGVKFKDLGSSPAKMHKPGHEGNFDAKGYLKGEQGFIPDYKGQSTKQTVHKVAKKVVKHTAPNVTQKLKKAKDVIKKSGKEGVSEGAQQAGDNFGRMKESGKLMAKQSMKKVAKPTEKKYTKVRSDIKMKPPYKKPVGPRAN